MAYSKASYTRVLASEQYPLFLVKNVGSGMNREEGFSTLIVVVDSFEFDFKT